MELYLLVISIPALASLLPNNVSKDNSLIFSFWYCVFLTFLFGLRHEVGGDWINYIYLFNNINDLFDPFSLNLLESDYIFDLSNWLAYNFNLSIYYVNFFNSAIFFLGLFFFAIKQPFPSMVFLVAAPYLIIVISTGYVRQASALGLILLSMNFLMNKQIKTYVFIILIASFFHKTVVMLLIFLPMFFLEIKLPNLNKIKVNYLLTFIICTPLIYYFFYYILQKQFEFIFINYLGANMHFVSKGALFRSGIFLFSAILFILFSKKLTKNVFERKVYSIYGFATIIISLFVFNYSSAVDRFLIYFYPLQLFVFSRLHLIFNDHSNRIFYNILVICFFFLVFFVWVFFGQYSNHWIPFDNILF
tara:strand:- start:333 stop:1415 length:1083 start_codon:yes stop_codon:yes gene_type:complete